MATRVVLDDGWERNLAPQLDAMLEAFGGEIEGDAKAACPVRTGRLRASIGHDVTDQVLTVGSDVEYAVYVEEGTRHMAPQPYLRPALYRERSL